MRVTGAAPSGERNIGISVSLNCGNWWRLHRLIFLRPILATTAVVLASAFTVSGCVSLPGGVFAADDSPPPKPGNPPEPPDNNVDTVIVTGVLGGGGEDAGSHKPHKAHHRSPPSYRAAPALPAVPATNSRDVASNAFRKLPIVYRRPKNLAFDMPTVFTLVVAGHDLQQARDRVDRDTPQGTDMEAGVDLSNKVEAKLWSPDSNVEIIAQSPARRDVSTAANTVWTWSVRPKTTKEVMIALDVFNVTVVNKAEALLDGPAYRDRFTIQVGTIDRAKNWVERIDPLWTRIAGAVTAIGGVIAFLHSQKRKDKKNRRARAHG